MGRIVLSERRLLRQLEAYARDLVYRGDYTLANIRGMRSTLRSLTRLRRARNDEPEEGGRG